MGFKPYDPFSLEVITEPVRIIRAGTVKEEFPKLAKCAHSFAGTVLGATVGEPSDVDGPVMGQTEGVTDKQVEEFAAAYESLETYGAADGDKALDPVTISLILSLVKMAFEAWRKRRNP